MLDAGASRCRKGLNDSTSQRIATSGQSGGRRKVCGMREVAPATHSLPFLERRSAPFFHEDVTPPFSMRPQPVRRAGFGRRGGARRAKLWDVWTLAAVCRPNPCFLPPACANQKPLGSGGLVVVAVRCRCRCLCLCLCRCLSSSPLDASTSTFLLAFPWRFSWRST